MKKIKKLLSMVLVSVFEIKKWIDVLYFIKIKKFLKVYCIGDSHTVVFKDRSLFTELDNIYFDVTTVHGATVSGLDNPNSKTKAGDIFKKKIQKIRPKEVVIFLVGEVDLGFVIWWRKQKYNSSLEEMYNLALSNYKKLLMSVNKCRKVIVVSVPLPTIPDNYEIEGEVANLRKEIKSTQQERTKLTLRFNKDLEMICKENGFKFVSLDDSSLDQDTGVIKATLLNENSMDHHYNQRLYGNLLQEELKKILAL